MICVHQCEIHRREIRIDSYEFLADFYITPSEVHLNLYKIGTTHENIKVKGINAIL